MWLRRIQAENITDRSIIKAVYWTGRGKREGTFDNDKRSEARLDVEIQREIINDRKYPSSCYKEKSKAKTNQSVYFEHRSTAGTIYVVSMKSNTQNGSELRRRKNVTL